MNIQIIRRMFIKNFEEFNQNRMCNELIVFDDLIADMICNKKFSVIVTEIFIRGRKLNILTILMTQSYFQVSEDVGLYCTYFFYYENSKQTRASTNSI